jgi:hypothetical protein
MSREVSTPQLRGLRAIPISRQRLVIANGNMRLVCGVVMWMGLDGVDRAKLATTSWVIGTFGDDGARSPAATRGVSS